MFMNPLFWLFALPGLLLGFYAQSRIKSNFAKYSQVHTAGNVTGAQVARTLLDSQGLQSVVVEPTPGVLTDHYDPIHRRLALSQHNYRGTSLAALGVAAHEAGHAIQHKVGYAMMGIRQTMVPATRFAAGISNFAIIAGFFLLGTAFGHTMLVAGAIALGVICLFHLVTLPVEFDASRRAKAQLVRLGILDRDEMPGVNETLNAAGLTYVAAFAAALGSLLQILLLLAGGRRN